MITLMFDSASHTGQEELFRNAPMLQDPASMLLSQRDSSFFPNNKSSLPQSKSHPTAQLSG